MELTLESLIAEGYTQDQATQIIAAHKAALSGHYIPKSRFDEVNTALKERDTQLAQLKQFEGTAQELQAKVVELETANKAKDAEMAKALANERRRNAMLRQLDGKVHDADLVLSQIDVEKVSVAEDGTLTGFSEQVDSLKSQKGFLFVAEDETAQTQPIAAGIKLSGTTPPDGKDPTVQQNMSEAEQVALKFAKQKLATQEQVQKGTDAYFKIN